MKWVEKGRSYGQEHLLPSPSSHPSAKPKGNDCHNWNLAFVAPAFKPGSSIKRSTGRDF